MTNCERADQMGKTEVKHTQKIYIHGTCLRFYSKKKNRYYNEVREKKNTSNANKSIICVYVFLVFGLFQ